jgi:transposase-like protein
MRGRYSGEQWAVWIRQQRDSGLSIAALCESIRVSENSFYLWRKKLQGSESAGGQSATSAAQRFVPVAIVATSHVIEVDLPCGATMRSQRAGSR